MPLTCLLYLLIVNVSTMSVGIFSWALFIQRSLSAFKIRLYSTEMRWLYCSRSRRVRNKITRCQRNENKVETFKNLKHFIILRV